jgi:hypothetical protein
VSRYLRVGAAEAVDITLVSVCRAEPVLQTTGTSTETTERARPATEELRAHA